MGNRRNAYYLFGHIFSVIFLIFNIGNSVSKSNSHAWPQCTNCICSIVILQTNKHTHTAKKLISISPKSRLTAPISRVFKLRFLPFFIEHEGRGKTPEMKEKFLLRFRRNGNGNVKYRAHLILMFSWHLIIHWKAQQQLIIYTNRAAHCSFNWCFRNNLCIAIFRIGFVFVSLFIDFFKFWLCWWKN